LASLSLSSCAYDKRAFDTNITSRKKNEQDQ
jgi:hypothetical protein